VVLGELGAEPEAHFRMRLADGRDDLVEAALRDAEALEHAGAQRGVASRAGEPGEEQLFEDPVVLAWDAGQEEERAAIDAQRERGRAPVRVAEDLASRRDVRLAFIVLGHRLAAARGPSLAHPREPALIEPHSDPGGLRRTLGGEVVGSRPEPARDDAEVRADARLEERAADVFAAVAHHDRATKLETERVEPRRGPGGVRVGDGTAHHLVARDHELDDGRCSGHVSPRCDAAVWMPQVPANAQTPAKMSSSTTPAPFFQRGSRSKNRAGGGLRTSKSRKRTKPAMAASGVRGRRNMVTR